jgi:hypothetical protein
VLHPQALSVLLEQFGLRHAPSLGRGLYCINVQATEPVDTIEESEGWE